MWDAEMIEMCGENARAESWNELIKEWLHPSQPDGARKLNVLARHCVDVPVTSWSHTCPS